MEKILITGISGFIGVNLSIELLQDENNIIFGIDDFSNSSFQNLYKLLKNPRFNLIEGKVNFDNIPYVDKIYHLAGCGDFKNYFADKYSFIKNKMEMLDILLNLADKLGSKILFCKELSLDNESHSTYNNYLNLACDMIKEFSYDKKIDSKIVSIPSCYGKFMDISYNSPIQKMILNVLRNENIVIEKNLIDYYTYIDDVVASLNQILDCHNELSEITISSNKSFSLKDVASYILFLTKSSKNIEILNNSSNNIVSVDKIDFICKTNLINGLKDTIGYVKQMYFS